jgi:hypothetical protein
VLLKLIVVRVEIVLSVSCKYHHTRDLNAGGVVTIFTVGVLEKLVCPEEFGLVQLVGKKPNNWAFVMLCLTFI